jgi:hypothetical protein
MSMGVYMSVSISESMCMVLSVSMIEIIDVLGMGPILSLICPSTVPIQFCRHAVPILFCPNSVPILFCPYSVPIYFVHLQFLSYSVPIQFLSYSVHILLDGNMNYAIIRTVCVHMPCHILSIHQIFNSKDEHVITT